MSSESDLNSFTTAKRFLQVPVVWLLHPEFCSWVISEIWWENIILSHIITPLLLQTRKPKNQHESAIHYHTWYIVEHLGSNHCFEWRLGMTSRLHSANTLVEGMNKVGHGSVQDRKRALEEQIAVTWLHALIFPSLWPLDRNLHIMGIWFICMVNHFFAPFLRRVVHEWMPYDARRATRLPPSLQKSHQADTC